MHELKKLSEISIRTHAGNTKQNTETQYDIL